MRFKYSDLKKIKKYMVKHYSIKSKCKTKLIKDAHTIIVSDEEGDTHCFGCINRDTSQIYLPIANRFYGYLTSNVYGSYAHELAHAYQLDHGLELDEQEADDIAQQVLFDCLGIATMIQK